MCHLSGSVIYLFLLLIPHAMDIGLILRQRTFFKDVEGFITYVFS